MNEQDRKLLDKISDRLGAYGDEWPESMVIGCLRIIDRLDTQLAKVKEAGELVVEEMEAGLAILPAKPHPGTIPTLRVTAWKGRRLAQALKGVKDG